MKIVELKTFDILPYPNNPRQNDNAVDAVAESIRQFGFKNPIILDKEKVIVCGHTRWKAAKKLGLEKVPCIIAEDLTDEQVKAFRIADNKVGELAEWDKELLSNELKELQDVGYEIGVTGFSIDDIIFTDDEAPEQEINDDEIKSNEPRIKRGEIWKLGNHRLMCGDSTDEKDVEKLCAGETIDLLETDPPYNVDYHGKNGMAIENDNTDDKTFIDFLNKALTNGQRHMKAGAPFYIWCAGSTIGEVIEASRTAGLPYRQQIMWIKNTFTIGRQDYQWKHENCLYGWKDGAAHYFIDCRSLSTVNGKDLKDMTKDELIERITGLEFLTTTIHENKPTNNDIHPTMKPLPMIKKQIRNSSKEGEKVLDLFGGSGTTLMACEEQNRRCFMMEFDEHYAEEIIKRFENETGKRAEKEAEH